MGGKGYEAVLLSVSRVIPLISPLAASYSVLPTCFAFFMCTGAELESPNASVVSAGNGRHSSRMTRRRQQTMPRAKRLEKIVFLHVQSK